MLPEVGRSRQARQNASVLFPDPDSPTKAKVVFGAMEKETPSSADTSCRLSRVPLPAVMFLKILDHYEWAASLRARLLPSRQI